MDVNLKGTFNCIKSYVNLFDKININKGSIIKHLNQNEAGNIELEVPLIKSNNNKNDLIFFALLITYLTIFQFYRNKNL